MKIKICICIMLTLFMIPKLFAQDFGTSKGCHLNVNDPILAIDPWKPIIDATFKYGRPNGFNGAIGNGCTGTLINRKTSDGNLGFYFVTARHCFREANDNPKFDFSKDFYFYFSYQSRNSNNSGTALSNRGTDEATQTGLYNTSFSDDDDYHYGHRSKIRVVAEYQWGDFMLCEILTPLPPHFDVTFSGWNPSPFRGAFTDPYRSAHHPQGDIKKGSLSNDITWLHNPIATGCYTITKWVDVLVGWLWKRRWSTSVVCKYVEIPYFLTSWAPGFGGTEQGSSGAGIVQGNGKLIGTLHGGPYASCDGVMAVDMFGKLSVSYGNKTVKNTMNPDNDWWTDIHGLGARKITCYPSLDLPGATNVSGEYVPAFQHQYNNTIWLQSMTTITTNNAINIYDSADYRFRAGHSIILDNGFDAHQGSVFIAEIGGCQTGVNQKTTEPNDEIIAALREIRVPKQKEFDMSKYAEGSILSANNLYAQIYPNPNNGNFGVKISKAGDYEIKITDLLGKTIYTSRIVNTTDFKIQLSSDYQRGTYLVQINSSSEQFVGKVVITE